MTSESCTPLLGEIWTGNKHLPCLHVALWKLRHTSSLVPDGACMHHKAYLKKGHLPHLFACCVLNTQNCVKAIYMNWPIIWSLQIQKHQTLNRELYEMMEVGGHGDQASSINLSLHISNVENTGNIGLKCKWGWLHMSFKDHMFTSCHANANLTLFWV